MRRIFKNVFKFSVVLTIAVLATPTAVWADPAPAIVLETDWGRVEITLSSPGEVETMFFDAGDFNNPEIQAKLDMAQVGALKQKLKGSDAEINISPDKHHATLKHGQQVYWGMWIKDGGIGKGSPERSRRVDAVTIVMKTVPQWGYPDIVRNGFEIAYTEPIGTGVGVGNTDIRTDATFGKSFQVFNLPAARVTYFSFKARVCSGGVKTEFTPHFFKGPSITGVTPDNVTCCCHDTHELLLPVPECYYSLWQAAQVDCRYWCRLYYFLKCFREKLACRVRQATDEIANAQCSEPQATIELTITGDHLPKMTLAEAQEHIKITPVNCAAVADEFRILEVVASTHDTLTLKVEIVKCNPGVHQIAIDGVGGIATFTTNKVITVAPDVLVRHKVFDAVRVVGSQERLPVSLNMDGEVMAFAPAEWQLLSPTPATEVGTTQATSTSTGNTVNFIAATGQAKSRPEDTQISSTIDGEPGCPAWFPIWLIDLQGQPLTNQERSWDKILHADIESAPRRDLSAKDEDDNGADDVHDEDDDDNPKPSGTEPGLYVGLNGDDDNRNSVRDRDEMDAGEAEDDLQKVILRVYNAPVGNGYFFIIDRGNPYGGEGRGGIKIWRSRRKGSSELIMDGSGGDVYGRPVPFTTRTDIIPLWIEGTQLSNAPRDVVLWLGSVRNVNTAREIKTVVDTIDLTVIGPQAQTSVGYGNTAQYGGVVHANAELIATPTSTKDRPGRLHVYVFAPDYAASDNFPDDIDVEIFSYDRTGRYWQGAMTGGYTGTVEEHNNSSQEEVEPARTNYPWIDQEFWTALVSGFYLVDDARLFLNPTDEKSPCTVPAQGGGRVIVRLFQDLASYDGWTDEPLGRPINYHAGIRPPGWLVKPVGMTIVNPTAERIDANNIAHIDTPAVAPTFNGNEFTYSVATPGVLTIPVRIQITPDTTEIRALFLDRIRVRVSAIDDSHSNPAGGNVRFAWNTPVATEPTAGNAVYNPTNQLWEATATFTGLPPDNVDFGQKNVTALVEGDFKCFDWTRCEAFFPRDAANHPAGVATDPNWFYYWGQVYVNPNVRYVAAADTGRTPGMTHWTYQAVPNKTRIEIGNGHPTSGKSYGIGEEASGIDRYVKAVIHEEKHVAQIAKADVLLPTNGADSFRFGWSWNQEFHNLPHNHWRKGLDRQWGIAGEDDDRNGIVDDAAVVPPFEPGNGDDLRLDRVRWPSWPDHWLEPTGVYGTIHPIEGEAVKASDDATDENDYARQDWGAPGKNHKTSDKWDD